jgi:hypothetical protein
MQVIYSPLHARHDGGVELHRGALVPSFEAPVRAQFILEALQRGGFAVLPPRDIPQARLQCVHDAEFLEFLRTAYARWSAKGRDGSMLPSGFPARGLRRDHRPSGINGAMGWYTFPVRMDSRTATSIAWPNAGKPRCSAISWRVRIAASGLATFCPAYLGALPWTGSNIETPWGLMFADCASPSPPHSMAPRSVKMSPNMLLVTMTS